VALAWASSLTGFWLFAGSWAWAPDAVIIGGYSLIAVGGMTFFQCGFKAQYAFPTRSPSPDGAATGEVTFEKQTLIIAGITTLGDASVCMWLLFEFLHTAHRMPLADIFAWYGVVTTVLAAALGYLWHVVGPEILSEAASADGSGDDDDEGGGATAAGAAGYGAVATVEEGGGGGGVVVGGSPPPGACVPCVIEGQRLQDLPFAQQLRSSEFLLLLAFQTVHTTRANLYLGLLAYFFESAQFQSDPATNPDSVCERRVCHCVPLFFSPLFFSSRDVFLLSRACTMGCWARPSHILGVRDCSQVASAVNVASALVPLGCLCAPLVERLIETQVACTVEGNPV
jgi:hypothetical protein